MTMNDLFQTVFQSAFDSMILLDPVRESVRAVNLQTCKVLGYSEQEIKGLSWKQLFPRQPELLRQLHRQVVQQKKGMMRRVDVITATGKLRRLEMSASAVMQGIDVWLLLVLRDAQQRQQADSNMARLNQIYSLLSVTNRVLFSCETRTDLFDAICQAAIDQGGFRMAWVGIFNDTHIVPVATAGHVAGYLDNLRSELKAGKHHRSPIAAAIQMNTPAIVNAIRTDAGFQRWRDDALARGYFSMISLPVALKGQVVAVLSLYSATENDFEGPMVEVLGDICTDITLGLRHIDDETRRLENESKLRQLSKAVESAATAVIICDSRGIIEYVNPQFVNLVGYSPTEIVGLSVSEIGKHQEDGIVEDSEIRTILLSGQEWRGERESRKRDGTVLWTYQHISPIRDEAGRITHFVSTVIDHTDLHFARETIERLAYYDELTALPNRRLSHDRLQHAIDSAQRDGHAFAFCFLDLDGFKSINDFMGHEAGDVLLKTVSQRLKQCIRAKDTVARLGGDEFTLILRDIRNPHDATVVVEHVIYALSRPVKIQDTEVAVTTSVGIALYPEDGLDIATLTRNADMAMYHAKAQGKNTYRFFTAELNEKVQQRVQKELELRRAFERRSFFLLYQPQFDTVDGAVMGLEIKPYWETENGQKIPPAVFWDLLVESGLVVDLVLWAIERAMIETASLKEILPQLILSIDISDRHLRNIEVFIQQLEKIAQRTGGRISQLMLEVPESVLSKDVDDIVARLRQLRKKGVKLAMDHFGTGSSSLRTLRQFPVELIKIDSSFVSDVLHDENDAAITAAILALAHQLELKVLAEGVTSAQHAQFLERYWCECVQGDYYCVDSSIAKIREFLTGYLKQHQ
ncbi:Hypothetical protein HDN1F_28160 [gamma proteobacterium HdN1]|nr:Hypothetical protein HDN1F_28160 [gamma proteobacterium HdN1]